MMGQVINAGTGMCDIFLDEEKMIKGMNEINITSDDFINVTDKNIDNLLEDDNEDISKYSDYCDDDNFEFSV